jgi:hypothetical protein
MGRVYRKACDTSRGTFFIQVLRFFSRKPQKAAAIKFAQLLARQACIAV